MEISLIISAFVAGLLTFLAPCTLPLIPVYLGFIGGVSFEDLQNHTSASRVRRKIFLNSFLFVLGFSGVFVLLGSLFGLGGAALIQYRMLLSRIGGIFIILFGLFMIGVVPPSFLKTERRIRSISVLKPGKPISSFLFGAIFAFGWTPCVGPILGSILTLAASTATVGKGAFLLSFFSFGLAMPFLTVAAGFNSIFLYIARINHLLKAISTVGGLLLVILGVLLFFGKFGIWVSYFYRWFHLLQYDRLLDYL